MTTDAVRIALTEFPQLQRLIDLVDAGWMFLPSVVDGEITQVHGVRMWHGGWADAIRVRYTTDAIAVRGDHEGGLVWKHDGTLTEVVDALITLPPPNNLGAPRLVKGSAPTLWTP